MPESLWEVPRGETLHLVFFIFSFVLSVPHVMWDLSSPTRDGTHALCSGSLES